MSDLLTHIGRLELVDVDLDKEPQCEGCAHNDPQLPGDRRAHDAGPATHVMRSECGIGDGLRCAAYVAATSIHGGVCPVHGWESPGQFRFVEL